VTTGLTQLQAATDMATETMQQLGGVLNNAALNDYVTLFSQGANLGQDADQVINQGTGETLGQEYAQLAVQNLNQMAYTETGGSASAGTTTGSSYGATPLTTAQVQTALAAFEANITAQGGTGYSNIVGSLPAQAEPQVGGFTPSSQGYLNQPITINITGMTPANAQQVSAQMVTALRQAGLKIT
jgi:hypothetical protein